MQEGLNNSLWCFNTVGFHFKRHHLENISPSDQRRPTPFVFLLNNEFGILEYLKYGSSQKDCGFTLTIIMIFNFYGNLCIGILEQITVNTLSAIPYAFFFQFGKVTVRY
jgi:hypothetical protein